MPQEDKPVLKVLICDDDPVDRKLIRAYLKHIDDREFILVEAGSEEEIREALEMGAIDLILLDVQMPERSGMEWLSELAGTQLAPVVMVTGFGSEEIAAESIQEGAIGYLSKVGLSRDRLQSTIDKSLSRWRQLKQSQADQQELERLALHDALTGVFNRRAILLRLEDQMKHARRYREDLSVLMLDIDHFKTVNDRYGHLTGDRVLCMLAQCLLDNVREVDFVGRTGGEEFIATLPRTDASGASVVAERLRAAVAGQTMSADAVTSFHVTISIGVAASSPNDTTASLLDRADRAMYAAKNSGRNTVRVAPTPWSA